LAASAKTNIQTNTNNSKRISFGKVQEPIELPDLLGIQKDSYKWLLDTGIKEVFKEYSPLIAKQGTGNNKPVKISLTFDKIQVEEPENSITECRKLGVTYSADVYATVTLTEEATDKDKHPEPKRQTVKMCELPLMTPSGTFIINGTERVIVSQLVPSPGVYFEKEAKKGTTQSIYFANIRASRGLGLWFEWDQDRETFFIRSNKKGKKTDVLEFLYLLGFDTNKKIEKEFAGCPQILDKLEKTQVEDFDRAKVFRNFHTRTTQVTMTDLKSAEYFWSNVYFSETNYDLGEVGRYKLDKRLGLNTKGIAQEKRPRVLEKQDIVTVIKYLCHLIRFDADADVTFEGPSGQLVLEFDDINYIGNRRVRPAGELCQNVFRTGLMRLKSVVGQRTDWGKTEIVVKKEKTSALQESLDEISGTKHGVQKTERKSGDLSPRDILNNSNILQSVIRSFFGSSQLSQFMDQNNPLAEMSHRRRISVHGPDGVRMESTPGGSKKHFGEGIRDVQSDQYGRICPIESPEGQNIGIVYALASFARINKYGFIETPYRVVKNSIVTDEVVYLAEDEERRNVIAQASELFDAKTKKFVKTHVLARLGEGEVDDVPANTVTLMDVSSRQMVSIGTSLIPFLEHDDANRALMGANMQRQAVPLVKTVAPFVGTGSEERVALDSGDVIRAKKSGVVTECHSNICKIMDDNGKTETYIARKFERANQTTCFNNEWIVNEGDRVDEGQAIADGPATKDGELAIGQNLLVAFMNFDGYNYEDAIIISNRLVQEDVLSSIHIEEYDITSGKTRLGDEEITRDIPNVSEDSLRNLDEEGIVRIGAEVKTGDILVGKVTPKGEKSYSNSHEKIIEEIFGAEKGKDVRNSSLVVPNGISGTVIGVQKLEGADVKQDDAHTQVKVWIASKRKIGPGDKMSGRHGNKGVISTVLPIEDMPFLEDGTPVDIILNPLGVPGRMNIGQILEVHLGWIARNGWDLDKAGTANEDFAKDMQISGVPLKAEAGVKVATPVFDGPSQEVINGLLRSTTPTRDGERLVKETGKATLIDGRTGEPFPEPISVGVMYMLKLHHLVDDKVHARSVGRNTLITKQPLGGKAQFGGQRIGEMEVWALEAYGAAHVLHEMLTIKSDDTKGSFRAYDAIVKGINIPEAGIPESFKVLLRELQSLGLNVDTRDDEPKSGNKQLSDNLFKTDSSNSDDATKIFDAALLNAVAQDAEASEVQE
jgi:DNA-directed RNA polymerase subunit beta